MTLNKAFNVFFIMVFFSVGIVDTAYAYLDPGSGGALLTVIWGVIVSFAYSIKKVYYRLVLKEDIATQDFNSPIIIFAENSNYKDSFDQLIGLLIKERIAFHYITMDYNDPYLKMESPYLKAKLIFNNFIGQAQWLKLTGEVMLTTSPNIGAKGYLKRPKGVKKLVHFFHSIADIGYYKKYSLDAYDEVLLVGDFQKDSIREIEKLRALPEKKLIPVGLPYFDKLLADKATHKASGDAITVLVASSWGEKGLLHNCSPVFINDLAQKGYNIIMRPHPHSMKSEPEVIADFKAKLSSFPNIVWDETRSPHDAMSKSDIMISDTSSIRYDFAFIYERPVISVDLPLVNMSSYELSDMKILWGKENEARIGVVINIADLNQLSEVIERSLEHKSSDSIITFRNQTISSIGTSANNLKNYLVANKGS